MFNKLYDNHGCLDEVAEIGTNGQDLSSIYIILKFIILIN